MQLQRTDSSNEDFKILVKKLDAYLSVQDGEEHSFYDQYNKIDTIKYALVAYQNGQAVGCGSIKELSTTTMEVKRMYVPPEHRGKGIATTLLQALEAWAKELGYQKCRLETGKRHPEALSLYHKTGYQVIENYGQYQGIDNSVCFEKQLNN